MEAFGAVYAVLDFAIAREQEAVVFYESLASKTPDPIAKKTFLSFAKVERKHKEKLEEVRKHPATLSAAEDVTDLNPEDYLVEADLMNETQVSDALLVAVKREKAAKELYAAMEKRVADPSLRALFKKLAHEETAHETKFEAMYAEHLKGES